MVRVRRLERPASWTQIKRSSNWTTPGYKQDQTLLKESDFKSDVLIAVTSGLMVVWEGLEPSISRLSVGRSNQLSYQTLFILRKK